MCGSSVGKGWGAGCVTDGDVIGLIDLWLLLLMLGVWVEEGGLVAGMSAVWVMDGWKRRGIRCLEIVLQGPVRDERVFGG